MRFGDHAYQHSKEKVGDPTRVSKLDAKAKAGGFESTPDYIHDVQGRKDTVSMQASNDRVLWANEREKLVGWNNHRMPERSTVFVKESEQATRLKFQGLRAAEAPKSRAQGNSTQIMQGVRNRQPVNEKNRTAETSAKQPSSAKSKDGSHKNTWSDDRLKAAEAYAKGEARSQQQTSEKAKTNNR
ncbi:MAG: hypothetical protein ABJF07_09710 [Nisaea sp.]|uniref:hypothetical protein n=1 Tax=Nisaea sp. TaxID=2024842 RepID=UPI003266AED2